MIPFVIPFIFIIKIIYLFLFLRIREKFEVKDIPDAEIYGDNFKNCVTNCTEHNNVQKDSLIIPDATKKEKETCWISKGNDNSKCNNCEYKCLTCNDPIRCNWYDKIYDEKNNSGEIVKQFISGGKRSDYYCYEDNKKVATNFIIKIDSFKMHNPSNDNKDVSGILRWNIVGDLEKINEIDKPPSFVIIIIPKKNLETNNYSYKNTWLKYIPVDFNNPAFNTENKTIDNINYIFYTYDLTYKDLGYNLELKETYIATINMKLHKNIDGGDITNFVSNSTELRLENKRPSPPNGLKPLQFEKIDSNKILNEILGKTFEISI